MLITRLAQQKCNKQAAAKVRDVCDTVKAAIDQTKGAKKVAAMQATGATMTHEEGGQNLSIG